MALEAEIVEIDAMLTALVEQTAPELVAIIEEGRTKKEAFRCLKRYIAREIYQ